MKIGIIAEDDSDVAVMREFTCTLLKPHVIGVKRFVGDGCGKLRRKYGAWARNLVRQGCSWVVVVHDLDAFSEQTLRLNLTNAVASSGAKATVVLIPRREIEAWLLYDCDAIAMAFKESKRPKLPGNPESLVDPKKHLRDLIRKLYRKDYLNTVHNPAIAKHIDISALRHSPSFVPHFDFTRKIKNSLN